MSNDDNLPPTVNAPQGWEPPRPVPGQAYELAIAAIPDRHHNCLVVQGRNGVASYLIQATGTRRVAPIWFDAYVARDAVETLEVLIRADMVANEHLEPTRAALRENPAGMLIVGWTIARKLTDDDFDQLLTGPATPPDAGGEGDTHQP